MKKYSVLKLTFVLILLLLPLACQKSTNVPTRTVRIAIGDSLSPYVIAKDKSGFEYEIVKEAFLNAGYVISPVFVEYAQVPYMLLDGKVDAAMTQKIGAARISNASDVYITYHDYAITKKSRNLKIRSVDDLKNLRISAFQNADNVLGPEFKAVAKDNPKYSEVAEQYQQNIQLYKGMVDVVISDKKIFDYYAKQPIVTAFGDKDTAVVYHDIFPPTPYRITFRQSNVRDAFNKGLRELKNSGRYQQIIDSYSSK